MWGWDASEKEKLLQEKDGRLSCGGVVGGLPLFTSRKLKKCLQKNFTSARVLSAGQEEEVTAVGLGAGEEEAAVVCEQGRGKTVPRKKSVRKSEWPSEARRSQARSGKHPLTPARVSLSLN